MCLKQNNNRCNCNCHCCCDCCRRCCNCCDCDRNVGDERYSVRRVRLNNRGWFVVRLQFVYTDSSGRQIRTRSTGDIRLGETVTVDPGEYGVPEGATFRVHASVVAGRDKTSVESFVYSASGNYSADFVTTGTTLINSLVFDGLSWIFGDDSSDSEPEEIVDDDKFC